MFTILQLLGIKLLETGLDAIKIQQPTMQAFLFGFNHEFIHDKTRNEFSESHILVNIPVNNQIFIRLGKYFLGMF